MFDIDLHKKIPGLAVTLDEASDIVKTFLDVDFNRKSLLEEILQMKFKNSFKDHGYQAVQQDTFVSSEGYTTFVQLRGFIDDAGKELPPLTVAVHVVARGLFAMGDFDGSQKN